MPLDFFHGLWRNHCKRVYHFTGSKPVFQSKRKFSFARLLRSLRSDWEDVKCKSNIFWFLDFKSFVTHCWIKIISVSHFSPASRPLRSPPSRPSLSRLPYPSRPLFSRAPAPLSPPHHPVHIDKCSEAQFTFGVHSGCENTWPTGTTDYQSALHLKRTTSG